MAWAVTVLDTYAELHISQTAREQGAAVIKVSASTTAKYGALSVSHAFYYGCSRDGRHMWSIGH